MKISGIYKITNTVNGKYYLGSSDNIKNRWKSHLYSLRHNKHHSIHLQRAWNKYGEKNFIFELVEEVDKNVLLEREQYHLDTLTPWDDNVGYNVSKSASGGDLISYHPNIDEIREKQRINTINRWNNLSEKEKELYSEKMSGDGNPNWKGGISYIKFKCPICGKETKTVNNEAKSCMDCKDISGEKNPFFGKKHSNETKIKLRLSHIGKKHTEETKSKCRESSNKFYNSEEGIEFRRRLSLNNAGENHPLFGVGHTEESKLKMSTSKKQKYENMTLEEKVDMIIYSKKNMKIIRADGNYFLNCREAAKYYNKSTCSINFRCLSSHEKWKEFIYLSKQEVIDKKQEILDNIKQQLVKKSSDVIDN
jgi:group I intron endonuclease